MPFCPECGAENEEEARYCSFCGAPMRGDVPRVAHVRRGEEKDEKIEKQEKNEKEEKTEPPTRNWVALIGLLIVISGLISLLDAWNLYWWADWDRLWPYLIIVLGLFIIWNGFQARTRSPRP